VKLSGWGRFPKIETKLLKPRSVEEILTLLKQEPDLIARGNGRSYGDSSVNSDATLSMLHMNRMHSFNAETGQLIAEAGVLLSDVISSFLPRGWFPSVTPGTKFITLGGAVAADVHGKNHHKDGSFRECVDWVEVVGSDGQVTRCSSTENSELFDHTLGGMGLTGIIVRVAIKLRRVDTAWIRQTTYPAANLKAAIDIFESSNDSTYSVAWIDCLASGADTGRSLIMLGEHASLSDLSKEKQKQPLEVPIKKKKLVPFDFPSFTLNQFSVRAFNTLYYSIGSRKIGQQIIDWDTYFYPLDAILGWNRIYGNKGLVQFQCVFPLESAEEGLTKLLQQTAKAGAGSFLAVLKRFGSQDSAFSFPMEGYTLALDFPVNSKTLSLLDKMDRIVIEHGGRFYLAKDGRMSTGSFQESETRCKSFREFCDEINASEKFSSSQSKRLSI
jgi:FAD/FMN-containing dehydrogenase